MINEKDVKYIANLSRIHLRDGEIAQFTKSLENILHYVQKLDKLDVKNIAATSHVLPLKNIYREDNVATSLSQDDVMRIAIEKHHGAFKVPKVIE